MALNRLAQMGEDPEEQTRRRALSSVLGGTASGDLGNDTVARYLPNERTSGSAGSVTDRMIERSGGNTGITGGMPKAPLEEAAGLAQTSGAASAVPTLYGLDDSWDRGKLEGEHDSPKYQIGRTLRMFDPRAGVTPEVLAALNKLGLGTFSGERDKLSVGGSVDPRFNGVTAFDVGRNFSKPDGSTGSDAWSFQNDMPQASAPVAAGGPYPIDPGGVVNGRFDTGAASLSDESLYRRLLAQLQSVLGPDTNEQALSSVLGGR